MNKSVIIGGILLLVLGVLAFQFLGDDNDTAGVTPSASVSVSASASLSPSVSATVSASVSPSASRTSSPQVSSSPRTHTIRITAAGVSTKNLTIKRGDTVTWINEDTKGHWIASGPHPQHTTCPTFDPKRALSTGETFSSTFNEAKTCPFHDHINASNSAYNGSIIVQ